MNESSHLSHFQEIFNVLNCYVKLIFNTVIVSPDGKDRTIDSFTNIYVLVESTELTKRTEIWVGFAIVLVFSSLKLLMCILYVKVPKCILKLPLPFMMTVLFEVLPSSNI